MLTTQETQLSPSRVTCIFVFVTLWGTSPNAHLSPFWGHRLPGGHEKERGPEGRPLRSQNRSEGSQYRPAALLGHRHGRGARRSRLRIGQGAVRRAEP